MLIYTYIDQGAVHERARTKKKKKKLLFSLSCAHVHALKPFMTKSINWDLSLFSKLSLMSSKNEKVTICSHLHLTQILPYITVHS